MKSRAKAQLTLLLTRMPAAMSSLLGVNATCRQLFETGCADAGATGPSRSSTSRAVVATAIGRANARVKGRAVTSFI
jgi:hypothetical protein